VKRFVDPPTAIVHLVGLRALSGDERPTCLCNMRWKLSRSGTAVMLTVDTAHGEVSVLADLPERTTVERLRATWFGEFREDGALRDMPTMGSA
jgi:hypothetical protein